ncbi:MAG: hypothetical protein ABSD74_08285 [Rhizomicrobium sp.]|jgi:hypothetical protein
MKRFLLLVLLCLPAGGCLAIDTQNAAGHASTAIRIARNLCTTAWAKPVPDETHWGALLVGDRWRIWLKDRGGTPNCALAMVTVERRTAVTSGCNVCPSF